MPCLLFLLLILIYFSISYTGFHHFNNTIFIKITHDEIAKSKCLFQCELKRWAPCKSGINNSLLEILVGFYSFIYLVQRPKGLPVLSWSFITSSSACSSNTMDFCFCVLFLSLQILPEYSHLLPSFTLSSICWEFSYDYSGSVFLLSQFFFS